MTMKIAASAVLLAVALSGCVIRPIPVARPAYPPGYEPPPGVVYVEPEYPIPTPGYVWIFNPRFGWGWHHPRFGWHRGWR